MMINAKSPMRAVASASRSSSVPAASALRCMAVVPAAARLTPKSQQVLPFAASSQLPSYGRRSMACAAAATEAPAAAAVEGEETFQYQAEVGRPMGGLAIPFLQMPA